VRSLKETLASERERMARMQQYDQERFRHLNVELQKMEERNRELQRGRDALLVQLHDLRFQVRAWGLVPGLDSWQGGAWGGMAGQLHG